GLMFFGFESAGARGVPVYATKRFGKYLKKNGPWSQLVRLENIILKELKPREPVSLMSDIQITALPVPHRQEFSDVVGFRVNGPTKAALFLPDIDSWEDWDAENTRIEDEIAAVDYALLDATFYANGEIPGRDMSGFPHPFVSTSMKRFEPLPGQEKSKVFFIHMNHTNPLLRPDAEERDVVQNAGYNIAERRQRFCLSSDQP
ncbi:MAG: MBL fold metallo-hydrolase, partial [Pseudomonadota bacterium]